jgi:two-component system, NtrC family, nitrogen regulation response regulator GlnG
MKALAEHPDLTHEAMWETLRDFVEGLVSVLDLDSVLAEALDALIEIFGADRGMILCIGADGVPYPVHARQWRRRLKPQEQALVSRTTIHEVLERGEFVTKGLSTPGTSESMEAFGIAGVLAGPLHRIRWRDGGRPRDEPRDGREPLRGVVYLDFRGPSKILGPLHLELFRGATRLLSLALDHHEQARLARGSLRPREPEEATEAAPSPSLDDLLGPSSMAAVRRALLPVVRTDMPILLLGESGTGKTQLAQAIAKASHRPRPFVRANLGHLDDRNTVISELFGHLRGAYTGADFTRLGKVERANGGTLFLDEILNLPLAVQPLLLDLLQDGAYEPLGWNEPVPKRARLRIIAATNGDLEGAVRRGVFRLDLFYRVAAAVIRLPSLRERCEDIPMLAEQILRRKDPERGWELSASLREALSSPKLRWAGNIRQLEFLLLQAMAKALENDPAATRLTLDHVDPAEASRDPLAITPGSGWLQSDSGAPAARSGLEEAEPAQVYQRICLEREQLDALERQLIEAALRRHDGVLSWAAQDLGMQRTGFASRVRTLGVRRAGPRRRAPNRDGG